jgi:hypothetical protein
MKLSDIFEERAVDFEFGERDLPNLQSYSKIIGTFDGFEIWGSRAYGDKMDTFCISENGIMPIAMVVISTDAKIINGQRFSEIVKVWVHEKHRGKALIVCIIGFIVSKMKLALTSGPLVTGDGEKLFKKMIERKSFKMAMIDNGAIVEIDSKRLFSFPNELQIAIIGGWSAYNDMFEHPIVKEMRKFRGCNSLPTWD